VWHSCPYLIVPSVSITNAASPHAMLVALLIGTVCGMVVLFPSLWWLFAVFKAQNPAAGVRTVTQE